MAMIFTAEYLKTDGTIGLGYFLSIYEEKSDNDILHNDNVIGCKITTQADTACDNSYARYIDNVYGALPAPSYVLANKQHLFHVKQIQKIIAINYRIPDKVKCALLDFQNAERKYMYKN